MVRGGRPNACFARIPAWRAQLYQEESEPDRAPEGGGLETDMQRPDLDLYENQGTGVTRVPTGRSVRYVVPMAHSPARSGRSTSPTARRGRPGYDLESLLAVAVTVFNERGYDGTSMEDLSRRLGIAKSSIYYHVDSKEDLLAMALDRALDGLFAVADQVKSSDGPAIERLEELVRGSVHVLADRLPYVTLLLRARGNTATERRALARRREFDQIVAELVAEAERDGAIRPDVDPAITARLLFGLVNSLVEWYRPGRRSRVPTGASGPTAASELADAVCAVAFDGLRIRGSAATSQPPLQSRTAT
jgi:AcrR family transcriptional regulator